MALKLPRGGKRSTSPSPGKSMGSLSPGRSPGSQASKGGSGRTTPNLKAAAHAKVLTTQKSKREEQADYVILTEKFESLKRAVDTLRERHKQLKMAKNTMLFKNETRIKEITSSFDQMNASQDSLQGARRNTLLSLELQNLDAKRLQDLDEYKKKCTKELIALRKTLPRLGDNENKALTTLRKHISGMEKKQRAAKEEESSELVEIEKLTAVLAERDAQLSAFVPRRPSEKCNHKEYIETLQKQIKELEDTNAALVIEKDDIDEHIEKAKTEMNTREKQFKEKISDETFEAQVETRWQQMYGDWMRATEEKIQELNQANTLLQNMVSKKSGK